MFPPSSPVTSFCSLWTCGFRWKGFLFPAPSSRISETTGLFLSHRAFAGVDTILETFQALICTLWPVTFVLHGNRERSRWKAQAASEWKGKSQGKENCSCVGTLLFCCSDHPSFASGSRRWKLQLCQLNCPLAGKIILPRDGQECLSKQDMDEKETESTESLIHLV